MRKIDIQIDELETVIDVAVVESGETPENVLSKVDAQLAEHGLELVIYDAFENAVSWRIKKREAQCRPRPACSGRDGFAWRSRTNLRSHKRTFNEVTYVSEITSGVDRRHTRAKPATGGIATAVRFRPIPL